jgi:hypothetical protein
VVTVYTPVSFSIARNINDWMSEGREDSPSQRRRTKLGRLPFPDLPISDCSDRFPCSLSVAPSPSSDFRIEASQLIIRDTYEDIILKTVFSFHQILPADTIPPFSPSTIYLVVGTWLHPQITLQLQLHPCSLFPPSLFHRDPFSRSPTFSLQPSAIENCEPPIIIFQKIPRVRWRCPSLVSAGTATDRTG